ncbi:MAG: ATP-binding protein [Gammaproteobacteria bacterium]
MAASRFLNESLEKSIESLLEDEQYFENPLRETLFSLWQYTLEQLSRLERATQISDHFQNIAQQKARSLSERYDKQLRQIEKIIRISDRYQQMSQELIHNLKESEQRLAILKEKAEAANRTKGEFLAKMSHELRTPLNVVLGYTQLLQAQGALSESQSQPLAIIRQSGEHLLGLIDDTLDMAKIEAKMLLLQPVDFELAEMLQGIIAATKLKAATKGLSFIFEQRSELPAVVRCDARRLRQILTNLLDNAVKYTHRGRVVLEASREGTRVRFTVEDTGVGIPADDLSRIFEIFHQVEDRRTTIEGTGLGLAICKHLVELLGGDLQVSSIPGKGSRFWFELNLPEIAGRVSDPDEDRVTSIRGTRRRILAVDDDPACRKLFRDILQPLGFEVFETSDGRGVLAQSQALKPDAILMDIHIPGLDGLAVTRQIRAVPDCRGIVIIAISASVFDYDRDRCLAAGCDAFLPKPFRREHLLNILGEHLELTLVYGRTSETLAQPVAEEAAMKIPGLEELMALLDAARRGDRRSLHERAVHLATKDESYGPFADDVRRLTDGFQMKRLRLWLEKLLQSP